ncbi:MAG TPA: OB-fold nucleic acid binding domain-containing protein, partial [Candidatus Sulfotelmatobacter sp.]|nr:OB-fold nucleic acid binding domain-containing protein [Candidatus Sulfotelmatobacter sp.]
PRKSDKDHFEFKDFTEEEKLSFEKEFLGFYLTAHPQFDNLIKIKSEITHEIESLEEEKETTPVVVGGIIESIRRIFTKKTNKEMAFLLLSNENGVSLECIIFPRIFDSYKSLLLKENVIIISGKIDSKNDKPVIIAEKIKAFNNISY